LTRAAASRPCWAGSELSGSTWTTTARPPAASPPASSPTPMSAAPRCCGHTATSTRWASATNTTGPTGGTGTRLPAARTCCTGCPRSWPPSRPKSACSWWTRNGPPTRCARPVWSPPRLPTGRPVSRGGPSTSSSYTAPTSPSLLARVRPADATRGCWPPCSSTVAPPTSSSSSRRPPNATPTPPTTWPPGSGLTSSRRCTSRAPPARAASSRARPRFLAQNPGRSPRSRRRSAPTTNTATWWRCARPWPATPPTCTLPATRCGSGW
jgi:hypothetical protein